jgi:hypothetical protein
LDWVPGLEADDAINPLKFGITGAEEREERLKNIGDEKISGIMDFTQKSNNPTENIFDESLMRPERNQTEPAEETKKEDQETQSSPFERKYVSFKFIRDKIKKTYGKRLRHQPEYKNAKRVLFPDDPMVILWMLGRTM